MPPRRISAADLFDTLEVDLWGNHYTMRETTRTVSARLQKAQDEFKGVEEETVGPDQIAGALIQIADILLAPVDGTPGAGELLRPRWESDEMGLDWLQAFTETLQEEAAARRRPTSAPTTSN